jgi:pantetheine-phosphate adenylyltransferase
MTDTDRDNIPQADRAVLLAGVRNVDGVPHFLAGPVATAASKTTQFLRIVLVSPLFDAASADLANHRPTALGTRRFDDVQRVLTYVYVQATRVAQEMGKILMDVDVLLRGTDEPLEASVPADAQVIYQSACTSVLRHSMSPDCTVQYAVQSLSRR